jgi:hypothetical protein
LFTTLNLKFFFSIVNNGNLQGIPTCHQSYSYQQQRHTAIADVKYKVPVAGKTTSPKLTTIPAPLSRHV